MKGVLKGILSCAVAVLILLQTGSVTAATVDTTTKFQKIDGLGAFVEVPDVKRKAGIFYATKNEQFRFDEIATDFGATMMRFELSPSFWPAKAQPYSVTGGVFGAGSTNNQFRIAKELAKRGCTRFYYSTWSPPCWMKTNWKGQVPCGSRDEYGIVGDNANWMNPANVDDFVKMSVDLAKIFKDSTGVDLYGISPVNEPAFNNVDMNACQWGVDVLSSCITKMAAAFTAAGLPTKVIGPEYLGSQNAGESSTIGKLPALYAFGFHYSPGGWATAAGHAPGKQLWDTEENPVGFGGTPSLLGQAEELHNCFTGGMSGFSFWGYEGELGTSVSTPVSVQTVLTSWTPNADFQGAKHYFRFVKAGARRISITGAGSLLATAFKNPDNTFAIILVNNGGATTIDLTGAGLPAAFGKYVGTGTTGCVYGGLTTSLTSIAVAGNAVTSLYSGPEIKTPVDTAAASLAEPNIILQKGQLNVFGDDNIDVYVNGQPVTIPSTTYTAYVPLVSGSNTIAMKLTNASWGGCAIAGMLLYSGDTLRSDATWKLAIKDPGAGWAGATFDDSKWGMSGAMGAVETWPGFAGVSTRIAGCWAAKARWMYGPKTVYFRKEFTGSFPTAKYKLSGTNFSYKLYLNGNLVTESTAFEKTDISGTMQPATLGNMSGTSCVGLEVTDFYYDGRGVLLNGEFSLATGNLSKLDSTWQASFVPGTDWNKAGFNASSWGKPSAVQAGGGTATYQYPKTYWFRKTFNAGSVGVIDPNSARFRAPSFASGVARTDYFTLQGEKIAVGMRSKLAKGTMMIQRTVFKNGDMKQRMINVVK